MQNERGDEIPVKMRNGDEEDDVDDARKNDYAPCVALFKLLLDDWRWCWGSFDVPEVSKVIFGMMLSWCLFSLLRKGKNGMKMVILISVGKDQRCDEGRTCANYPRVNGSNHWLKNNHPNMRRGGFGSVTLWKMTLTTFLFLFFLPSSFSWCLWRWWWSLLCVKWGENKIVLLCGLRITGAKRSLNQCQVTQGKKEQKRRITHSSQRERGSHDGDAKDPAKE